MSMAPRAQALEVIKDYCTVASEGKVIGVACIASGGTVEKINQSGRCYTRAHNVHIEVLLNGPGNLNGTFVDIDRVGCNASLEEVNAILSWKPGKCFFFVANVLSVNPTQLRLYGIGHYTGEAQPDYARQVYVSKAVSDAIFPGGTDIKAPGGSGNLSACEPIQP